MASLRQVGRPLLGRRFLLSPTSHFRPPLHSLPTTSTSGHMTSSGSRSLFTLTGAPKKRSSFKSFVARWALAGGLVYCYATSNVFAQEPNFRQEDPEDDPTEDEGRPRSLLPEKGGKLPRADVEDDGRAGRDGAKGGSAGTEVEAVGSGSVEELEEDADQQGAFNPETGEINWDCPCLGGMAHGPCGEDFKAAFSCFVFSTEDPKGADCIEKFKGMQTCFQKHPEVYGSDDEDEDDTDENASPEATDQNDPEGASSLAASPGVSSSPHADPEGAKPDTEPVRSKSKGETAVVTAKKEGSST